MSNELQKQNNSSLQNAKFNADQIDIIKNTLCKGITNDELKFFEIICQRTGLDPFSKQIYAIKRKNNKTQKEDLTIQTSIDGFRLIAVRTGLYLGTSKPDFEYDKAGKLLKCEITVYKFNEKANMKCDFTAVAFMDEYMPSNDYMNFMWKKMPHVMLEKCAEAKALRKAFPQELSGLYENSEMEQAYNDSTTANTTQIKEVKQSTKKVKNAFESPEHEQLYNDLTALCLEMVEKHGFNNNEVKSIINKAGKSKLVEYNYNELLILKDNLVKSIEDKINKQEIIDTSISLEDDDNL